MAIRRNSAVLIPALLILPLIWGELEVGYPLDGYRSTKIRRLEAYRLVQEGELRGRKLPPGALLNEDEIRQRLIGINESFDVTPETPKDAYLQEGIERIFRALDQHYSIALLDISEPANPKYAGLREDLAYQPGSVGKIVVMVGLFSQLARVYPDVSDRVRVLQETQVTADRFIKTDEHEVPIVNLEERSLYHRPIRIGDQFTLWEWVDHMVSPSSNAAASTVFKQVMLLGRFGAAYPVTPEEEASYFRGTPRAELGREAVRLINEPLWRLGLEEETLRQGSFFTREGKRIVPSRGSRATPRALLRFLLKLEQGAVVDRWSSLEMKKLLYVTRRRIRYAFSPELSDAAVYFKSGSLYSCKPEPGFECGQYRGNVANYMNSVAIIESPARGENRRVYLVALMSNVLRRNSAYNHQEIAGRIERLIRERPAEPEVPAG